TVSDFETHVLHRIKVAEFLAEIAGSDRNRVGSALRKVAFHRKRRRLNISAALTQQRNKRIFKRRPRHSDFLNLDSSFAQRLSCNFLAGFFVSDHSVDVIPESLRVADAWRCMQDLLCTTERRCAYDQAFQPETLS